MTFVGDWASKKREAEKLAACEAITYIHKPPSPPKTVLQGEKKDPLNDFQQLNLKTEESDDEMMECN